MISNLHKKSHCSYETLLINHAPLLFVVFVFAISTFLYLGPCSADLANNVIFCKWLHQTWLLLDAWSLPVRAKHSPASQWPIVPDQNSQLSLIKSQSPRSCLSCISLLCNLCAMNLHSQFCWPNFWMTWKDTRSGVLRSHMHNDRWFEVKRQIWIFHNIKKN